MENFPKTYFNNIEQLIIDKIGQANVSIHIAVAWFTSGPIKQALLKAKQYKPKITIEVVVDDNEVNEKYFLNTEAEFVEAGIVIHKNWRPNFLHRKFMVLDRNTTLIGSYNFTNKARSNAENIAIVESENFSQVHIRLFKRMTDENYFDENMQLLLDYPKFAQNLISTYYPFKRKDYTKFKDKIVIGQCYTYDVGNYDEIAYTPGLIFNAKYKLDKKLREHEFPLPISKNGIKNWIGSRDQMMIIDSYRELEEYYDQINDRLDEYQEYFDQFFKILIESTYSYNQLKAYIESDIDIIKEERLWADNFALFLDNKILNMAFELMPLAENEY